MQTEARKIEQAVTVHAKRDGTWLEFRASDGKTALLRIETIAESHGPIVGMALRQWCADQQGSRS